MGIVRHEDIIGIFSSGELICEECMSEKDWNELSAEEIITENGKDEDAFYFCDRCGKSF